MMNLKQQLVSFDDRVSQHIANKDWTELASYLVLVMRHSDVVCMHRKYTLQNILHSNLAIFKQVFLALNQGYETFFGVETLSQVIPLKIQSQLSAIFQSKITSPSIVFTRLDGRRRLFAENHELLDAEQALFKAILDDIYTNENQIELEKVLFEKISPIDVPKINNSYWHIDSLRDQLKVVLPIHHMHAQNAPMRYLGNISHLTDYDNNIWQKLHTIYKISGLSVSKANYFEPNLFKTETILSTEAQVGDVILFNPQIIHTGSICEQGNRDSITLYLNVKSHRNNCFQKIQKIK